MTIRSDGLSRKPLELDHTSLPSGVKYASCTSPILIFVICFVSRSTTRRPSPSVEFVRVNHSSFGWQRSEERRVGKEGETRVLPGHRKKNQYTFNWTSGVQHMGVS